MEMFRIAILTTLALLTAYGFCADDNNIADGSSKLSKAPHQNTVTPGPWIDILHRALMLYDQQQYEKSFELIVTRLESDKPGEGVHYCLQLARRSFAKMHAVENSTRSLPKAAQQYLLKIQNKRNHADSDLILLAILSDVGVWRGSPWSISGKWLTQLNSQEKKSDWGDWAIWEKARRLAKMAWVPTSDWGVVNFDEKNKVKLGCLSEYPSLLIRERAAKSVLRKSPNTYMAKQFRWDIARSLAVRFEMIMNELNRNEWYTTNGNSDGFFPFNPKQLEKLKEARNNVKEVNQFVSKEARAKAMARKHLEAFLWKLPGGRGRTSMVAYFCALRDLQEVKLPADVIPWAEKLKMPKPEGEIGEVKFPD
jgi:hypothetical protein